MVINAEYGKNFGLGNWIALFTSTVVDLDMAYFYCNRGIIDYLSENFCEHVQKMRLQTVFSYSH